MTPALVASALVLAALGLVRGARAGRYRAAVLQRGLLVDASRTAGIAGRRARLAAVLGRVFDRRSSARYDGQLPTALDVVAGAVRSGGSLLAALDDASRAVGPPLADDLVDVVRGAAVVGLDRSLKAWTARRPSDGVKLVAAALSLGATTGGGLAGALDGLAASLRSRSAAVAEARALSAQARLSAVVIGVAPVAFCGFTAATDHTTAAFLFGTPAGRLCLVGGVLLDGAGWLWMSRVTAIELMP